MCTTNACTQRTHARDLFYALHEVDPASVLPPLYHLLHHFLYALFEFKSLEVSSSRRREEVGLCHENRHSMP